MADLSDKEAMLEQYLKEDNKEAAVKHLYEMIVEYAKTKDFSKAEELRERIFEIDDMALNEIVKSGEIIEQEKIGSRDQDHMDTWSELYGSLSEEEANAIYYSMEEATYNSDELIFKQGQRDTKLYFINDGEVKLIFVYDNETISKTVGAGLVIGQETFFFNSIFCTVSMVTVSPVKLSSLSNEILNKWKDEFPTLESKLQSFCSKSETVNNFIKGEALNRRAQNRVKIEGRAIFQLVDNSGGPSGKPFRGELMDISAGGLSFFLKISQKETARLLLGRKLNMKFVLPTGESKHEINSAGSITGVWPNVFSDYSVHVQFDTALDQSIIDNLDLNEKPEVMDQPDLELKLDE